MKQAVILAAGEGQRLRPFTVSRPKAMLSVADKPVLGYIIEALALNGIRDIVLVVGYRKEQVFDYFGAGERFGVEITYVTQEAQLGTAHALAAAREKTRDEFLVISGDNLIEAGTIAGFAGAEPPAMLVKRVEQPARYGVVGVADGMVKDIVEKPKEAGSNLVNTGIYTFTRDIFKFTEEVLDIPDVINNMIAAGQEIRALEMDGTWLDIIYPWDIISLNEAILGRISASLGGTIETGATVRGSVAIGDGTIIRSGCCVYGPAVIGAGCDIGPQVCITAATSIGDNVVIGPFSHVRNSVIGNDVHIGPGSLISDSVIDRGCIIKARFTAAGGQSALSINNECPSIDVGVIMGEGCSVESNVSVEPGAIVGNACRVRMARVLGGQLPDRSLVY